MTHEILKVGEGQAATLSELYSLWRVQESLLQSYRSMFIGVESIFVSIASLMSSQTDKNFENLIGVSILGLATLLFWRKICFSRGRAVYLVQLYILITEQGGEVRQPLRKLKEFQVGARRQQLLDNPEFAKLNDGSIRSSMEIWFPALFLFAWVAIWFVALAGFNVDISVNNA